MSVTEVLFAILAVIISFAIYTVYNLLNYWKSKGVLHIKPTFPTGNFSKKRDVPNFISAREVYNKFKGQSPIAGFYFFLKPAALIMDLDLVKDVLIKDFSNFTERNGFSNEKDDPLTGHLLNMEEERWRSLRNKLSTTFTSGKMKIMFPTIVEVSKRFSETFGETAKLDNSVVEIKELLARFTTDVIGTCAFGIECNSLKNPDAEFRTKGRQLLTEPRHNFLITGLIFAFPSIARKLHARIIPDHIHNFFMRVVKDTVEYREKNHIVKNDFMNLLIELKNKKEGSLTLEQMAAQCFVFFLAGFETSSSTMGFFLYEMAVNQNIQDKVRAEIFEVLKKHNGEFTYESMTEMHYMEQTIKETLRKYSIISLLIRSAKNNYPIKNTNITIEKGTMCIIPADSIMMDPNIFPDPEVFNPDRFTPEEIQNRHPMAWLPFGDGPRNCIGLRFGKMQAIIGLVALLTKYKISISHKTAVPLQFDPTSNLRAAKGGIFLKVEAI